MIDSDILNGAAGVAALVNGLLLWPIVRSLKELAKKHDARITRLELGRKHRRPKSRGKHVGRS